MKRNHVAGVSIAVVSALLMAVAPSTVQAATSDEAPRVPAPAALSTADPANRYWGLPTVIIGDTTGMPMTPTAATFAGLTKDAGSAKYLPGWHAKGQRVLRGNAPQLGRISMAEKDGRYVVTVPVAARTALEGKSVKGAHEDIAVHLSVTDEDGQTIVDRTSWRTLDLDNAGAQSQARTFTLSRAHTEQIKALAPELRDANVNVQAIQVIDTDGRKTKGRWTAEHFKTSAISLGDSQAATQSTVNGQGVGLTVQNNDSLTNSSGGNPQTVNLTQQPTSCMQTGTSGTTALNVTGLAYGATTEGYLQQDAGDAVDNMLITGGESALQNMYKTVAAVVVSQTFAEVTDTLLAFYEAVKWLSGLDDAKCSNTAGMFTLTVADSWGNSTQQAYGLNEFFADGSGTDSSGGTQDTGGAGGMADIATVYNSSTPPGWYDGMTPGQDDFFSNYSNMLTSVYNTTGVGPAPLNQPIDIIDAGSNGVGGVSVEGGDAGLSLAVAPNASNGQTASGWGSNNAYPEIQLNVESNGNCSSMFGGTWVSDIPDQSGVDEPAGTKDPAQYWEATNPAAGCTGGNMPNTINPAAWGTPAITAAVGTGGAQAPITAAYINEPVSASATVTLAPATAGFSWAWYDCGTDSACTNPVMLSDAGTSTAWNAGFSTTNGTFTIPTSMNGNYLVLGAYPASLGGINPGTIIMSAPLPVQTLAPFVVTNPVGIDPNDAFSEPLTVNGANTLTLTGPGGNAGTIAYGVSLSAAGPNNWVPIATSGGTASYQTNWYGCNDVSVTSGPGVCNSYTSADLLAANALTYTVPADPAYDAVFFTQTVTVTYPNGAAYSATGESNTLFVGGGVPVFTTMPGLTVEMSDIGQAWPSLTVPVVSSPVSSGYPTVSVQELTCNSIIPQSAAGTTQPACPTGWQPFYAPDASELTGASTTTVDGVISGSPNPDIVGNPAQPVFSYVSANGVGTTQVAMVLEVTATNDSGSTTVYSNVWSATSVAEPIVMLTPPTITGFPGANSPLGTCDTTLATGTYGLTVFPGSYSLQINTALTTVTWTVTSPTGAQTVTTSPYLGAVGGTPVTASVQTYDMDGNPVPGGPWNLSVCWQAGPGGMAPASQ